MVRVVSIIVFVGFLLATHTGHASARRLRLATDFSGDSTPEGTEEQFSSSDEWIPVPPTPGNKSARDWVIAAGPESQPAPTKEDKNDLTNDNASGQELTQATTTTAPSSPRPDPVEVTVRALPPSETGSLKGVQIITIPVDKTSGSPKVQKSGASMTVMAVAMIIVAGLVVGIILGGVVGVFYLRTRMPTNE